jgi:cell division protein FtsB
MNDYQAQIDAELLRAELIVAALQSHDRLESVEAEYHARIAELAQENLALREIIDGLKADWYEKRKAAKKKRPKLTAKKKPPAKKRGKARK